MKNIIELYLKDTGSKFSKGFFYDEDGQAHELGRHVSAGMFTNSCLVHLVESPGEFVCRYFPQYGGIEFYNTIYRQQDYSRDMVIHNVGEKPLAIKFERSENVVVLAPGETKQITPEM